MSQALRRPATYDDVLRAPENHVAQVLDGELYVHPRPARRHTRAASSLGARLLTEFDAGHRDEGGDWIILDEPELHLGGDIVVPDLAGWRVERFPADVDGEDPPFLTVAPDWACEMLSPGTARVERMKKVPIYARERVGHVWLVDPRERTIEVFRLDQSGYRLVGTWGGDEGPFALEPFDAVPLPASAFWGRTLPK
jgi:Uma2 family endonuclease